MANYTDEQIKFIKELVEKKGKQWGEIADLYNERFGDDKTPNAIRKTYHRSEDFELPEEVVVSSLEKVRKYTVENAKIRKIQNALIDTQLTMETVLSEIKEAIKESKLKPIYIPIQKKESIKKEMAIEILYGDIHAGLESEEFNKEILEKRIKLFSHTMQRELLRYDSLYNVTTVIFAILGDLIENAYFHNMESMSACEIENSEQVSLITELTFKYMLMPLVRTGKKIIVVGIPGNHDRWLSHKTYNNPGKNSISYIIYNTLKLLCEELKLKNVQFIIPDGNYCTVELFGKTILYEHGDELKSTKEADIETHIHKRSKQIKKIIDFIRLGDKHNEYSYNKGRIIGNGCLCGDTSYSEVKGYSGIPTQVINLYVDRKGKNPFYHSFPIDLDVEEE